MKNLTLKSISERKQIYIHSEIRYQAHRSGIINAKLLSASGPTTVVSETHMNKVLGIQLGYSLISC